MGHALANAGPARVLLRLMTGIAQGLLMSVLAAVTGSILVSLVIFLADLEMDLVGLFRVFNYLSMGLGAVYAARYVQRMGWLTGALVAGLYFTGLTFWAEGNLQVLISMNSQWLMQAGVAALVGLIGGVIGVNL